MESWWREAGAWGGPVGWLQTPPWQQTATLLSVEETHHSLVAGGTRVRQSCTACLTLGVQQDPIGVPVMHSMPDFVCMRRIPLVCASAAAAGS